MKSQLPEIISSYAAFKQHIESQLLGLKGHGKGDPWQEFCKKLLPMTEIGKQFTNFRDNSRKTRDSGWDIVGNSREEDNGVLYVQAKYTLPDVNELGKAVSSFVELAGIPKGQMVLNGMATDKPNTYFAIMTLSDLRSYIAKKYSQGSKPSVPFFNRWTSENRIQLIDGPMIWEIVKDIYLKAFTNPESQTLTFADEYIAFGDVYLGVVAASEIKRIYREVGDAIFFENVRDFTGPTDVNQKIAETITNEPEHFLRLNNGIVFSASEIKPVGTENRTLQLDRASIVNGCQTTVTLVNTEANNEFYVQAKVVLVNDPYTESWQVTHAANYQNKVPDIDLDLARYIRPQVVKKHGYLAGIPIKSETVVDILDTFSQQTVTWRNVRILFIGLFSRDPGNMFDIRWDLVQDKLLNHYFQDEDKQRRVFEIIFALHKAAERGAEATRQLFEDDYDAGLFSRLWGDTRAPYMQYLGILSVCAFVDMNIAEREDDLDKEIVRMSHLLDEFEKVLSSEELNPELDEAYIIAFEKVAGDVLEQTGSADEDHIRTRMSRRITKQVKFSNLFRQVKLGIKRARHSRRQSDN